MLRQQMSMAPQGYLQGMDRQLGFASTSPSYPTPSTSRALAQFATARNMEVMPYQGVPRTQDTFAFSHQNEINVIVSMTLDSIETTDGWEFAYAPATAATALHEEIVVIVADDFMLERSAENTPARHIDLREERYSVSMEHFSLGFGMNREQLISDKGMEELRIKTQSFIAATIRTMKMAVKGAVIASPNYWGVQYQQQQRYNSIGEFDAQSIAMFGALTRTHKGLQMIYAMVRGMLATGARRPNLNMAVGPYALALQAQYRHGGPTEAHRVGADAAQRALSQTPQDYLEGLLPGIRYYTDKEQAPVNANLDEHKYPVDPFRRTKHLGAFSVLQHDDAGPIDPACGKPVPTVRCVTADANGWTEYSMRSCLEHCARFSEVEGTITEFTEKLIGQSVDVGHTWKGGKRAMTKEDYDPWVYEPKPMPGGEHEMTGRLRPCKHFGDQNTMHRPEEFDIAQGKKFKCMLNLSDEEDAQIRRLFEVAQYLYEVPTEQATDYVEQTYQRLSKDNRTEPYLDGEWGGPFLDNLRVVPERQRAPLRGPRGLRGKPGRPGRPGRDFQPAPDGGSESEEEAEGGAGGSGAGGSGDGGSGDGVAASGNARPFNDRGVRMNFIPYGFGDIFAVLSMLKNADKVTRDVLNAAVPMLEAIDYPKLASTMHKIWDCVKDVYPHITAKNAAAAPYFRKTNNNGPDEMISVLRGLFERVKHPVWHRDTVNGLAQGNGLELKNFGIYDVDEYLAEAEEKQRGIKDRIDTIARATVAGEIFRHQAYRHVAQHGVSEGDDRLFAAMYEAAQKFYSSRLSDIKTAKIVSDTAELNRVVCTMLTVHREAFTLTGELKGQTAKGYFATNAAIGTIPVVGYANDGALAQSRYGTSADRAAREEQRRQAQRFAPFDRAANAKGKAPELQQFSQDPAQFIDARRANEIGGLFLDFDMVEMKGSQHPWLVESPYMSRRTAYVGKALKGDPIARLGAFCFLASKVTRDACLALLDHGLFVPMNFILAWPFIQVDTLAMMFAEGGLQTARCNYMLTDVTRPEDGNHKKMDWNLTTWLGANNTQPCNQIIVPDVACAGYKNGLGSKLIRDLAIDSDSGMRLSDPIFDGCIPMDVPVTFDRKSALLEQHNPLPLFGKHDPEVYAGIFPREKDIFNPDKPHFASWPAYNAHFGFDRINEDAKYDSSSYLALRLNTYIPGTMYLRRTQTWTGETYDLVRGCKGTGHLDHIDPDKENFRGFLDGLIEFKDTYASY
jgi:hypothetical protein